MHKVQLVSRFQGSRRNRAGISVAKGEAIEVELKDEQLKALKADPMFTVTEVKAETKAEPRKMTDKQTSKKK